MFESIHLPAIKLSTSRICQHSKNFPLTNSPVCWMNRLLQWHPTRLGLRRFAAAPGTLLGEAGLVNSWTVEICFCPRSHWDVDMLIMLGMAGCWNMPSLPIWPVRVVYFYRCLTLRCPKFAGKRPTLGVITAQFRRKSKRAAKSLGTYWFPRSFRAEPGIDWRIGMDQVTVGLLEICMMYSNNMVNASLLQVILCGGEKLRSWGICWRV